jgi:hypothetical protein
MTRRVAALLAVLPLQLGSGPAACAYAQAAAPFPVVQSAPVVHRPHLVADLTLIGGAAMIGSSFLWGNRANQTYSDYLAETDPARIVALYDRTAHYDRLSSASLLGGEALVAAGLYLRFIRHPATERVGLSLGPDRCALSLRF